MSQMSNGAASNTTLSSSQGAITRTILGTEGEEAVRTSERRAVEDDALFRGDPLVPTQELKRDDASLSETWRILSETHLYASTIERWKYSICCNP